MLQEKSLVLHLNTFGCGVRLLGTKRCSMISQNVLGNVFGQVTSGVSQVKMFSVFEKEI